MGKRLESHVDLLVYRKAFEATMSVFELSKSFPNDERYSLVSQIRRASRSVCANMAEGWRKRRYEAAFVSKLSDAEGEAAETQVWLEFAVRCEYVSRDLAATLYSTYDEVLRMLVHMIHHPDQWTLKRT